MKMAQGYVTEDGTFFENKTEATLYEAELLLRRGLAAYNEQIDHENFLAVTIALMPVIRGYIDAFSATHTTKPDKQAEVEDRAEPADRAPPEIATGTGHVSSAEEDLAALLKLPTRGLGNVPDVGSGPRPEEVQERRTQHGPRVRGANASGVRSRKDMAVKQDTKA